MIQANTALLTMQMKSYEILWYSRNSGFDMLAVLDRPKTIQYFVVGVLRISMLQIEFPFFQISWIAIVGQKI